MKSSTWRGIRRFSRINVFLVVGVLVVLGGVSFAAISSSTKSDDSASKSSGSASSSSSAKTPLTAQESGAEASDYAVVSAKKANTVDSEVLQPGRYLIESSGRVANTLPPYNTKRQTECGIYNGTTLLASANAFNGGYDDRDPENSAAAFESISMEATVRLKSKATITLKCEPKDGSTRASMTLTATRVE